jgi:hypothetical protein
MKLVRHVESMRNTYEIFVGKAEEKRPLVRPRNRLEDMICV